MTSGTEALLILTLTVSLDKTLDNHSNPQYSEDANDDDVSYVGRTRGLTQSKLLR